MSKNKKHGRFRGLFWLIIGIVLIVAAFCLAAYNLNVQNEAGIEAEKTLQTIRTEMPEMPTDSKNDEMPPYYLIEPKKELPKVTIDGRDYIGIISIPKLELELPVLNKWTYENLAVSPCCFSGSPYTDDFVICAHNYSTYFGYLPMLDPGDEVIFTDIDGNRFSYYVGVLETLAPAQVQEMKTGEWDLTLFTCTVGGRARVAVRCEK